MVYRNVLSTKCASKSSFLWPTWGWFAIESLADIPRFSDGRGYPGGCYAIFTGNRLTYIGSASNLWNRLKGHQDCDNGKYNRLGWWPDDDPRTPNEDRQSVKIRPSTYYGEWATREIRLIDRLSPKDNTLHVRNRQRVSEKNSRPPRAKIARPLRAKIASTTQVAPTVIMPPPDGPNIEQLAVVLSRVGLSRSTLYARIADGKFPRPIKLGSDHRVGWLASDVSAAILNMVAASKLASA